MVESLIASLGALAAALGYIGYRIIKNKSESKKDSNMKSDGRWKDEGNY